MSDVAQPYIVARALNTLKTGKRDHCVPALGMHLLLESAFLLWGILDWGRGSCATRMLKAALFDAGTIPSQTEAQPSDPESKQPIDRGIQFRVKRVGHLWFNSATPARPFCGKLRGHCCSRLAAPARLTKSAAMGFATIFTRADP